MTSVVWWARRESRIIGVDRSVQKLLTERIRPPTSQRTGKISLIVLRRPFISYVTAELLLRLASLVAARHFTLGHVASQTTDVVLQDLVVLFELVVVRLDRVDAFGEGLEGGLERLGLPIRSQRTHSGSK